MILDVLAGIPGLPETVTQTPVLLHTGLFAGGGDGGGGAGGLRGGLGGGEGGGGGN